MGGNKWILLCLHTQLVVFLLNCYLNPWIFSPSFHFLTIPQEKGMRERLRGCLSVGRVSPHRALIDTVSGVWRVNQLTQKWTLTWWAEVIFIHGWMYWRRANFSHPHVPICCHLIRPRISPLVSSCISKREQGYLYTLSIITGKKCTFLEHVHNEVKTFSC